jgi:hypothetical protein
LFKLIVHFIQQGELASQSVFANGVPRVGDAPLECSPNPVSRYLRSELHTSQKVQKKVMSIHFVITAKRRTRFVLRFVRHKYPFQLITVKRIVTHGVSFVIKFVPSNKTSIVSVFKTHIHIIEQALLCAKYVFLPATLAAANCPFGAMRLNQF